MHWSQLSLAIRARHGQLLKQRGTRVMRSSNPLRPLPAGADAIAIASASRRLRRPLPQSYKDFLRHHDGWPGLFGGFDLFGAAALGRRESTELANARLWGLEEAPTDGVPFGADATGHAVVLWDFGAARTENEEVPAVLCMNGVVCRLDGFAGFLELVLELIEAEEDADRPPSKADPLRTSDGSGVSVIPM